MHLLISLIFFALLVILAKRRNGRRRRSAIPDIEVRTAFAAPPTALLREPIVPDPVPAAISVPPSPTVPRARSAHTHYLIGTGSGRPETDSVARLRQAMRGRGICSPK